jgi:hypothetical protein
LESVLKTKNAPNCHKNAQHDRSVRITQNNQADSFNFKDELVELNVAIQLLKYEKN